MSNRAIDAVLAYSDMTGSARLLMLLIANGINDDTAKYYAKTPTLASKAKCTPRWIELLIRKCVDKGELVAAHHRGAWATFYIPIFPGEQGYAPISCDDPDHLCSGEHTPLNVNRDALYREDAAERKRDARSRYPRRTKTANDSSPSANDSSPTPANDSSPSANDSSPSANDSSPSANDSSPHISKYPSLTPVLNQDIYRGPHTSLLDKPEDADSDLHPAPGTWRDTLAKLAPTMTPAQLASWLKPGKLFTSDTGYVLVFANASTAEQAKVRYLDRIRRELGADVEVRVRV